jgi:multimeric flavodoxin WrbA
VAAVDPFDRVQIVLVAPYHLHQGEPMTIQHYPPLKHDAIITRTPVATRHAVPRLLKYCTPAVSRATLRLAMYAIAISGSPRKQGNTETLLQRCLDRLDDRGVEGELVPLRDKTIKGCRACATCNRLKDKTCNQKDDDFHPVFEKMQHADIIVVGSPVYFGSATPEMMALLDRAGYVSRANGNLFSRKIGGPVAVARRAGHNFTFAQLLMWFMINDMVVPGSSYWNVALAREVGEVANDSEALATIERFADNLAWLAGRLL